MRDRNEAGLTGGAHSAPPDSIAMWGWETPPSKNSTPIVPSRRSGIGPLVLAILWIPTMSQTDWRHSTSLRYNRRKGPGPGVMSNNDGGEWVVRGIDSHVYDRASHMPVSGHDYSYSPDLLTIADFQQPSRPRMSRRTLVLSWLACTGTIHFFLHAFREQLQAVKALTDIFNIKKVCKN